MSKRKNDERGPDTFPDKWFEVIKKLPEFKEIADAAGVDELKKIIISSEGHISTVEKAKADDVKLNATRELMKEYSAPYKENVKGLTAKIKYALFLLEGKGVDLDNMKD